MGIVKDVLYNMLEIIPENINNEDMYRKIGGHFSVIEYIRNPQIKLELRDELISRVLKSSVYEIHNDIHYLSFKEKFRVLIDNAIEAPEDISIEEYVTIVKPQWHVKSIYYYRSGWKTRTMSVCIRKVKHIPRGSVCR